MNTRAIHPNVLMPTNYQKEKQVCSYSKLETRIDTNLSKINNLSATMCCGPWIAAWSQYSLTCWSIFLQKRIIPLKIILVKQPNDSKCGKLVPWTDFYPSMVVVKILLMSWQSVIRNQLQRAAMGPFIIYTCIESI